MDETKPRRTWFSRHAFQRVTERLTLRYGDVAQLLDDGLTLRVGEEEETGREHLLFYSIPDSHCFVAIRDAVTKTLVTVLPIEFYENLRGPVSWGLRKRACKIVQRSPNPQVSSGGYRARSNELKKTAPRRRRPAPYRVMAYICAVNSRMKVVPLGAWPATSAGDALADRRFANAIRKRLEEKHALEDAHTIVLQRAKDEPAMSFDVDAIIDFAAAA